MHSLVKALDVGDGVAVRLQSDPVAALDTDMLVLPGVGAFSNAATRLASGADVMRDAILGGLPTLGICLGMQLLFDASDEGPGAGLGVIPGRVRRLKARRVPQIGWNEVEWIQPPVIPALPVIPAKAGIHVQTSSFPRKRESMLSLAMRPADDARQQMDPRLAARMTMVADGSPPCGEDDDKSPSITHIAYFANSYVCEPDNEDCVIAYTTHERDRFASVVTVANTVGVQFHPEKSSRAGVGFVRDFVAGVVR
jgi:imidazoleglycerol phosphate synthase glutamine amidotransferase subunit HisH